MEKVFLSRFDKFFIKLAGQSTETVELTSHSEKSRLVTMGMVLLIPIFLGTFSGGYAATFVSRSPYAFTFGIVWGIVVYLIDRAILSINKGGFWVYLMRIIMALVIGLVISFPFKLSIFEDVIVEEQKASYLSSKKAIDSNIDSLVAIKKKIYDQSKLRMDAAWADYKTEVDGTAGSGSVGDGTIASIKKQNYFNLKNDFSQDSLVFVKEKNTLEQQRMDEVSILTNNQATGLMGKNKALGAVAEREPFIKAADYLLWAFFTLLELLPLLIKLMSGNSLYAKVVKSNEDAKLVAIENIDAIKAEAETIAATVPLENQINSAKLQLTKDKASTDTEMAKVFAAEIRKILKEEMKTYRDLADLKLSPERFDKLADQISAVFAKYADNIFEKSYHKNPEEML